MVQILNLVVGRQMALDAKEQAGIYRYVADRAYEKLGDSDRKMIRQCMYDMGRGNEIKNFGPTGAREVMMMIGILLAQLDDEAFKALLERRRAMKVS